MAAEVPVTTSMPIVVAQVEEVVTLLSTVTAHLVKAIVGEVPAKATLTLLVEEELVVSVLLTPILLFLVKLME